MKIIFKIVNGLQNEGRPSVLFQNPGRENTHQCYFRIWDKGICLEVSPAGCYGTLIGTTPTQIRVSPMICRVSKVDGAE